MLSAVKAGLVVGIPVALVGCADFTPRQVVEPSGVTLQAAIQDVQQSIVLLQKTPPEDRAGLMLDEVTVTFNVAASANAKNSGQINLSVNPNPAVTAGAMGSVELTNDANRGNTIVMKFKNLATADYSKGSFVTPGTGDYPGRIVSVVSTSPC